MPAAECTLSVSPASAVFGNVSPGSTSTIILHVKVRPARAAAPAAPHSSRTATNFLAPPRRRTCRAAAAPCVCSHRAGATSRWCRTTPSSPSHRAWWSPSLCSCARLRARRSLTTSLCSRLTRALRPHMRCALTCDPLAAFAMRYAPATAIASIDRSDAVTLGSPWQGAD